MMRTRFTYVALLLAVCAGTALTLVSCSPEPTAPRLSAGPPAQTQKVKQLRDDYGWMGQYHTDALVAVHSKLSAKENRGMSKAARCRVATAALKDFHKSFRRNGRPLAFADVNTVDGFCDAAARGDFRFAASLSAPATAPSRDELSPAGQSYFELLLQVLSSYATQADDITSIASIEAAASRDLTADEAGAIVGLASIAYSSTSYWDTNFASWRFEGGVTASSVSAANALSMSTQVKTGGASYSVAEGRSLWKIDLAAALTTLLYEWWLGTIALEKAAIRGAAASLVAALMG